MTAVSNSNTQREFIESQAQQRGYAVRLQCITADANVFTTTRRFDRIISIEMFEVGTFNVHVAWLRTSNCFNVYV